MKIVADEHIPYIKDYFGQYQLFLKSGRNISADDVNAAEILLVRSITPVTASLLKNSSIKFVGSITAGLDHLDINWLDEQGIGWSVASGFNASPVADYVISVIACLRKNNLIKKEKLRAAVIGVGHVGKIVSKRLSALGIEVILCDPIRADKEAFASTPLADIHDVDLITLHVPLTLSSAYPTHHMIDREFLVRQKKDCVLINTSRGAIVNTAELLKYGQHLLWCFDVWENEPAINHEVLHHAYIATPHIAGYSCQAKLRGIQHIHTTMLARELLSASSISTVNIPHQTLNLRELFLWEDIALKIFDPLALTHLMKAILRFDKRGRVFDELRQQFKFKHEFQYCNINPLDTPTCQALDNFKTII